MVESGERNPTADVIAKLRKRLTCTWDDLFDGVV